jgi:hypothetical protein
LTWRSQHERDDLTDTLAFLHAALQQALELCEQDALLGGSLPPGKRETDSKSDQDTSCQVHLDG